jgi:tripartite-type tricarboxylate transporter receptor subunit TctC
MMTDTNTLTRRSFLAATGASALAVASPALAAYPDRPIKWIVPYAAGGGADIIARLVGSAMSAKLGQAIVIENRPGASTNIGADAVAKAPPDGYTLLTADNGTLVNNTALFAKLPFDPDRDLRPVGLLARFHLVLTASRSSPISSAQDFAARAKNTADGLNFGSPGVGSPHHLTMARLTRDLGLRLTHVPYRGMSPMIADLLSGSVETGMVDYAAGGELMRSGQVRPLAVCSPKRLAALPDVPTIDEAFGRSAFEAYAWQGLMTTGKASDEVAGILGQAHAAALGDAALRARMNELGVEPLTGGPSEFAQLIQAERKLWVPLIRELGLNLN